jgi:hypothetical protein
MTFSEILPFLNEGFAVRRAMYCESLIIFKQIPASIDDVTYMKSIPNQVKSLLLKFGVGIDYQNQYIIYDFITGEATYCVFDGDDINALDWEVVKDNYNPYE